jgi:hypothetical protein
MCLNRFEINQTYLNPAGPWVSVLSLPTGPTLSRFHPSASLSPSHLLSLCSWAPPFGPTHSSAPPLSLPSLSSLASPACDPAPPSSGSCPGPPAQARIVASPPSSSMWSCTNRTPIPLFPHVPPATKGVQRDPPPLFLPRRKPSSLCACATLPPLPHRAPPRRPLVARATSSTEIRAVAAAMATLR